MSAGDNRNPRVHSGSIKTSWPRADALEVAEEYLRLLRPVTERIIVAGSLRRGKAMVGDVEILCVPRFEERQTDMFATEPVDLASEVLDGLLKEKRLSKRPGRTGVVAWGAQNKLAVDEGTGIPVDFFLVPAENWWVSLVVRTGSKNMNLELTTGARKLGRSLNAYGAGVTCSDGSVIPAVSEEDVFRLCGVAWRAPEKRT